MPNAVQNGPKNNLIGEEEEFKTAIPDGGEPSLAEKNGQLGNPTVALNEDLNTGSYYDPSKDKSGENALPSSPAEMEPGRKFVVVHGAVSGVGRDRKGVVADRDFYTGTVVTSEQIEGNEAYYISMGAIQEVE